MCSAPICCKLSDFWVTFHSKSVADITGIVGFVPPYDSRSARFAMVVVRAGVNYTRFNYNYHCNYLASANYNYNYNYSSLGPITITITLINYNYN